MTENERLKHARGKAKETSEELFRKKPSDVKDELVNEQSLGNPDNLVEPDDEEE
jgi:hypothetical protein